MGFPKAILDLFVKSRAFDIQCNHSYIGVETLPKLFIVETRPAWAGFKTAEVGIAIIMCFIW